MLIMNTLENRPKTPDTPGNTDVPASSEAGNVPSSAEHAAQALAQNTADTERAAATLNELNQRPQTLVSRGVERVKNTSKNMRDEISGAGGKGWKITKIFAKIFGVLFVGGLAGGLKGGIEAASGMKTDTGKGGGSSKPKGGHGSSH